MSVIQAKKKVFSSSLLGSMNSFYAINRYLLDPIAPGASAIVEIPVNTTKGRIAEVKCQCNSNNYDLYIYPFPVVDKQSIMVTYDKLAINKVLRDVNLSVIWAKYSSSELQHETHLSDIDKSVYVEIVNHGGATGDIYFELTNEIFE